MKQLIHKIIQPRSNNEDLARKEFILNVLLFASSGLMFLSLVTSIVNYFFTPPEVWQNNSLSLYVIAGVLLLFIGLYKLSRKGFVLTAGSILLSLLFLLTSFMAFSWGVDLPAGILFYTLIIVMSGILIGTRAAFLTTGIVVTAIAIIGYIHRAGIIAPNRSWSSELWDKSDIITASIIFGVITVTCWLSNREITKALQRARTSEAELKIERDSLEEKVVERTRELRTAQMEQVSQLYRFAEFGRLSSGLFHDLTNQITALSLNMEQASMNDARSDSQSYITKAMEVSDKMRTFIESIRKQLAGQRNVSIFSLRDEINEVLKILSYKAKLNHVELIFNGAEQDVTLENEQVRFTQIITNLVSNAIDAYLDAPKDVERKVIITLTKQNNNAVITVTDFGSGISEQIRERIFEPFFTTKNADKGTGIGLPLTKSMVEKNFNGTITVESKVNSFTTFTLTLPLQHYVQSGATDVTTSKTTFI